jgi:hypothetical protein
MFYRGQKHRAGRWIFAPGALCYRGLAYISEFPYRSAAIAVVKKSCRTERARDKSGNTADFTAGKGLYLR